MAACYLLVESARMGDEMKRRAGWDKNQLVSLLDGELEQEELDGSGYQCLYMLPFTS